MHSPETQTRCRFTRRRRRWRRASRNQITAPVLHPTLAFRWQRVGSHFAWKVFFHFLFPSASALNSPQIFQISSPGSEVYLQGSSPCHRTAPSRCTHGFHVYIHFSVADIVASSVCCVRAERRVRGRRAPSMARRACRHKLENIKFRNITFTTVHWLGQATCA